MKIAYEPHPVTPERKAELRAQGFKIIDARFAPKDATPALAAPDLTREGIAAMSKDDLCESLEAHGVTADKRKSKATLADELAAIVFMGEL